MKLPIPNDWDGESWKRFAICWPDSLLWRNLLLGFITYPTRGRSWDEKTGIIKDAQSIGWQIYDANIPLEEALLSCSEGDRIAKAIIYLATAVSGQGIENLATLDLDEFFSGGAHFTEDGLANRIGPQVAHDSPDTVQATIARLDEKMEGLEHLENMVKAHLMHLTAMIGTQIDFSEGQQVDEIMDEHSWDFTQLGLANRIGPIDAWDSPFTLSARMDQVREAIENLAINVNIEEGTVELPGGEELGNIVTELEELGTIWETRSVAETEAQNTNFSDLVTAIEALQLQCETIVNTTELHQNFSCDGGGSGGAGTYPADPSGQTTTPEDQLGDPPPGFESWDEFEQYQCDMAHLIVEQMISDIAAGGLLAATYASIATLAPILLISLLTPIGWAEIIIIAGLFITIWLAGVNISLLSQLLEDNKEEFVCELLSGTDVVSSISAFGSLSDSKVDGEATLGALPDIVRNQVKNLLKSYASIDSINRLYEKTPLPPPGGNDCSECGEPEWWAYLFGTVVSYDETQVYIQANAIEGYLTAIAVDPAEDLTITLHSGSMTPPPNIPECVTRVGETQVMTGAACNNPNWTTIYDTAVFGPFTDVFEVDHRSADPFTIRVQRNP